MTSLPGPGLPVRHGTGSPRTQSLESPGRAGPRILSCLQVALAVRPCRGKDIKSKDIVKPEIKLSRSGVFQRSLPLLRLALRLAARELNPGGTLGRPGPTVDPATLRLSTLLAGLRVSGSSRRPRSRRTLMRRTSNLISVETWTVT